MKPAICHLAASVLLLMLTSCEYKELCYDHHHSPGHTARLELDLKMDLDLELDLDLEVEVEVETHTRIEEPEYMKVCWYAPAEGNLQNTEFVGGTGGPLYTPPGVYDMVAYSFGTEYVQIRGEGDINTLEAFTSDITATKASSLAKFTRAGDEQSQQPIIYTPDHLLVAHEQVTIPSAAAGDSVITIKAVAATIVETYIFEVTSVVGAEYIESVEAFVTNQTRSSFFGRGEVSQSPATLSFPVGVDRAGNRLITAFNTFGKLPGESESYLHILIRDTGGKEYKISEDITDQFEKPDHHIIIDAPLDIPRPETSGGGIAPSVDPWQEEINDVPIG